ncbi:unnamed protein product, partial [Symbiodinium pilosum]
MLRMGRCEVLSSVERAALLFAEADFLRTTQAPGVLGNGGVPGPARDEMDSLVHRGQRFLIQAYRHMKASSPPHLTSFFGLFAVLGKTPVPLFELLDRLDSQVLEALHLVDSLTHPDTPFFVHVLPTPNVESNHVRAFFELHCDADFKSVVEEHQDIQRPLTIVEVGTHLGGCVLWAMTHLPPQTRALAVDAYGPAVAALKRTAEANGLADVYRIVEDEYSDFPLVRPPSLKNHKVHGSFPGYILHDSHGGRLSMYDLSVCGDLPSEKPSCGSCADWNVSGAAFMGGGLGAVLSHFDLMLKGTDVAGDGNYFFMMIIATEDSESQTVECTSLENVFEEHSITQVDLMRIHVLGREYDALRSGESFFKTGKVKVLAASVTQKNIGPGAMAKMLLGHGYALEFLQFRDQDVVTILNEQQILPK